MKNIFSFLLATLITTMCVAQGFNLGQIPKFADMRWKQNGFIPDDFIFQLKKEIPKHRLEDVRFSGTLSNSMNLDFPGAGNSDAAKLENAKMSSKPIVSWLEPLVEISKQLGAKQVTFTINSHEPFLGRHTLENSLRSLDYVAKNTNLIAIELENETYYSEEVLGYSGTPNVLKKLLLVLKGVDCSDNGVRKRINKYLDYLEFTVVPAIKNRGYNQPLGISTHVNDNQVSRIWNQEVLKRKFWNFLTPHLYTDGYDEASIRREFKKHIDDIGIKKYEIRITEFGADSDKVKSKWSTTAEVEKYILTFEKICKEYGVLKSNFHTIWANGTDGKGRPVGNFYSYYKE